MLSASVCVQTHYIQSVGVSCLAYICYPVSHQDIERYAAQPGEVPRFGANAAIIVHKRNIANVELLIFIISITPNEVWHLGPMERYLRDIIRTRFCGEPHSCFSISMIGLPIDAGDGNDQTITALPELIISFV